MFQEELCDAHTNAAYNNVKTHRQWWVSNSMIPDNTSVFCVYSSAAIFHLSFPLSWFLSPHLCLHLLSSLCSVFLLLFSSLSLSSSWLGEITPPHRDTLSSLAGWWNMGRQSNAASLVVEIMSWGSVFIWSYWSCTVLIHPALPTTLQKHTPFWCVGTIAPFCLNT